MSQAFRTDSAVVGPIKNASSNMTGGTVFVILATIPGKNFLYAVGYDSNKVCHLLEGGLGVYLTGTKYTNYTLPYFKYRKPNDAGLANYDYGDDFYTIGVYTDVGAQTYVGTLKMDNTNGFIVDSTDATYVGKMQLVSDDAYTFPGLPSLLTGVGYYMPEVDHTLVNYIPSTGLITSGDYAGLANTTPDTANVASIPKGTRFYACQLQFFSTDQCVDSKVLQSNLVYYQCPRTLASSTTSDRDATYYKSFCGDNAMSGLTSTTLCQLTNGTLPYYAYANGLCGDTWPDGYSLSGMDGKTYTAKTTYGMAYDGLCLINDKTNPTAYESMSLQDAFDQLIDEGDVKPPDNGGTTSTSIPWWVWLLLVLLIVGIIVLAVMLFMNTGKSGTKTEVNSKGNLEKITVEDS